MRGAPAAQLGKPRWQLRKANGYLQSAWPFPVTPCSLSPKQCSSRTKQEGAGGPRGSAGRGALTNAILLPQENKGLIVLPGRGFIKLELFSFEGE